MFALKEDFEDSVEAYIKASLTSITWKDLEDYEHLKELYIKYISYAKDTKMKKKFREKFLSTIKNIYYDGVQPSYWINSSRKKVMKKNIDKLANEPVDINGNIAVRKLKGKYVNGNGGIYINKDVVWITLISLVVDNNPENIEYCHKEIQEYKNTKSSDYDPDIGFEDVSIEFFAISGIDPSSLINKNNITKVANKDYLKDEGLEDEPVYRKLKGKTILHLMIFNGDYLVYCVEDSCCYSFNVKYPEEGLKRCSLSDVKKASDTAYKDLKTLLGI